ncbi:carbohydrate binding domain-containing protein [candidate division KSB1 bacterium]|nr:carbohydrate binding domain-containing protein [candidate division KSB1 bacterium]
MKIIKIWLSLLLVCIFVTSYTFAESLNLLENPGFENKFMGNWKGIDSCRVELNNLARHSGKYSLAFYPLKEGDGVHIDVSAIMKPGYRYAFTGWFRNAELNWGQVDVFLGYKEAGKIQQVFIGRADCDKNTWKELTNQFFIPAEASPSELQLVIKTGWGRNSFLVDDLVLRPVLQIKTERPTTATEPDIIFQVGPQEKKRSKIQVNANIFDHRLNLVKQIKQSLDSPIKTSLPAGFYHIVSKTQDLDAKHLEAEKIYYIGTLQQLTENLKNQSNEILTSNKLTRYHGWLRYLQYLVSYYQKREGAEADRTLQTIYRLTRWTQTIQDNPAALDTLSGVQEWAYFSKVDDSGQPFKLAIPIGYDSQKTYPLVVVMHGYGGNHLDYSGGVRSNPDYFELHVLGRARGGGYTNLSESDVLDAVDYVRQNWRIDDQRIHITGTSMGGGGTFKMTSRYPDRWASGRPVCGYGTDQPVLNALHVPIYSTHSVDDPTVPVLTSRAPLQRLIAAGGQVIIDETNGLQHAAWNYNEGNNRSLKWIADQVRPYSREVRFVDYTAIDRYACKAYWLKVAEWGKFPGPARFKATAGLANQLYLELNNIRTLQIDVSQSPFNPAQNLRISVNGKVFIIMDAPLPDSIFVTEENGNWSLQNNLVNPPVFVLHTPGSVHNLYHHEPLLIVYGTGGDEAAQQAMKQAAIAASKSVHPMWVGDQGDIRDGVPNHQLLYGHLKMKPDTAVTETDLAKHHLVLIGKASENKLIAKIKNQLPVKFDQKIICSDGLELPGQNAVMGLYFYNPLASAKLIYWVAADNPTAYRPYNILFQLQDDNPCGSDLLVVQENPPKIVKVRHFDSRWNWSDIFKNSAMITESENSFGNVFKQMANAVRKTTGSDYTLQAVQVPAELQAGIAGITQWSDFAVLDITTPIATLQMKGSRLLSYQKGFSAKESNLYFYPAIDEKIEPEKTYQVAMSASYPLIQQLINSQNNVPDSFKILDMTVFDAMRRMMF